MDVMTLAARLTLDTSQYESGLKGAEGKFQKAGKSIEGMGKKLSARTIALGQFAGNILTKVAEKAVSAVTSVVKDSVKAFADYEQLVGGVKTLYGAREAKDWREFGKAMGYLASETESATFSIGKYGKAQKKVEDDTLRAHKEYERALEAENLVFENASKAYMTAGMSINQYMETATSFASSLVDSLKGDTLEAARMTDMAVQDMADNANKMGSSLESIQNAYKGFAKGNFTMLDNLKLGYGGTRKEMQRLLKDAGKLTGKKYKIDSMSDIIEAINAIQKKKGITGTTQKEAKDTIWGSKMMLQAAWQNVLAALAAPDDLDLSGAIQTLTESAKTYLNNIFPVVQQIVSGLGDFMEQVLPDLMEKLPDLIMDVAPKLWRAVKGMFAGFGRGVLKAWQNIKWPTWEESKAAIRSGWKSIQDGVNKLGEVVFGKNVDGTIKWPTWDDVQSALTEAWNGIVEGVNNLGDVIFGTNVDGTINWPTWEDVGEAAGKAWQTITEGLKTLAKVIFGEDAVGEPKWPTWDDVLTAVNNAWNSIVEGVGSFFSGIAKIAFGEDAVGQPKWPSWKDVGKAVGAAWLSIRKGIADFFTSAEKIIFGEGGVEGFKWPTWDEVKQAVSDAWTSITTGLGEFFDGVAEAVFGEGGIALPEWPSWDDVKAAASIAWTAITTGLGEFFSGIPKLIFGEKAVESFKWPSWDELKVAASVAWTAITTGVSEFFSGIPKLIFGEDAVESFEWPTWDDLKVAAETAWTGITAGVSEFFSGIAKLVFGEDAVESFEWPSWDDLKAAAETAWTGIKTGIGEFFAGAAKLVFGEGAVESFKWPTWEDIGGAVTEAWDKIRSSVSNLGQIIFGEDTAIGGAFHDAINWVQQKIRELKKLLGIDDRPKLDSRTQYELNADAWKLGGSKEEQTEYLDRLTKKMQEAGYSADQIKDVTEAIFKKGLDQSWVQEFVSKMGDADETASALLEILGSISKDWDVDINLKVHGNLPSVPTESYGAWKTDQMKKKYGGFAKGLPTVPYDNFIANLHRDEMVLSASQARKYREGQNGLDVAAFSASVVQAVREGMAGASVNSYLDGKGVTDKVNRRTSNRLRARRFAPA